VCDALTGREQVCAWAPYTASRDLGTVGPATLTMIGGDTAQELAANVVRADRPRLLEYAWGEDLLRWELSREGPGTRPTLRHTLADQDWLPKAGAA
jgi:hypothetical protein